MNLRVAPFPCDAWLSTRTYTPPPPLGEGSKSPCFCVKLDVLILCMFVFQLPRVHGSRSHFIRSRTVSFIWTIRTKGKNRKWFILMLLIFCLFERHIQHFSRTGVQTKKKSWVCDRNLTYNLPLNTYQSCPIPQSCRNTHILGSYVTQVLPSFITWSTEHQ